MCQIATNFWHLIGAKLGFSYGEEQASDEVAVRVATVYKQFLHQFDTIYVASFLQESQKRSSQQGQPQSQNLTMPPQPPPTGSTPIAGNQQPQPQRHPATPQHLQQISQGPLMSFPGNPPYTFNQMIPYAYITAAELKMRGINEQFIAHVEEKRQHLQRFIEQHQEMRRKQAIGGGAGVANNTPGLGMGLSGLSGTQPQQAQLQPQMMLNASQQMNPNLRQAMPSGMQGATSKLTEGTGISFNNMPVNDAIQRSQMPQPPQMPTQSSLAHAIPNPHALRGRPSQEQINNAAMFVQRTKKEYMTRSKPSTAVLRRVRRAYRSYLLLMLQV